MRITAIETQARNPDRVNVFVDGVFRCALAAEIAHSSHLRTGARVDEDLIGDLEARDAGWRAREVALNLLSFRARTRAEVQRRLRQKEFSEEVIQSCLEDLAGRGLLDDSSFAESFVRDRLRVRPRGPQLLLRELRTKGVDPETARSTLDGVWQREELSEIELARKAARRWAPKAGETRLRGRRRLYNFLARRGFDAEVVYDVVNELLP